MRNRYDEDDDYDYWPNELAELASGNKEKYDQIINSNLEDGDTIEKWEQRNLAWAKECLDEQRRNKR